MLSRFSNKLIMVIFVSQATLKWSSFCFTVGSIQDKEMISIRWVSNHFDQVNPKDKASNDNHVY